MIFYESIYEACQGLSPEERAQTYEAVINYGCADVIPEGLSPIANAIFVMAKPLMDVNKGKRESGRKGGRPKKEQSTNKFVNFQQSGTDWDAVADRIIDAQNREAAVK